MGKTLIVLAITAISAAPVFANSPEDAAKAWDEGRQADAVAIWQDLGAKGDKDALYNLGQSARTGRGMVKDATKAVAYYRQALKLGHPKAGEVLGLMLFADPNTKAEGLSLLQQAAATGSPRANFAIAITELPTATDTNSLIALRDRFKLALAGGIEAARESLAGVEQRLAQAEVRIIAAPKSPPPQKAAVKIDVEQPVLVSADNGKLWRASLGEYESNAIAAVKWMRISARQRLRNYPVFIEQKAARFQLAFGNFTREAEAHQICKQLTADKTKCSVFEIS